jgi:hypothetical protein
LQRKSILILSVLTMLTLAILAQAQNGYTNFCDPKGQFCMQVPQGWPVQGESYVDSTGIPCYYVDVVSPDNSIIIAFGDRRVNALFPQISGKQYAEWYYQNFIASSIQGVQIVSDNELQDGSGVVEYTDGNNAGVVCAKTMHLGGKNWVCSLLYNVVAPSSEIDQAVSIAQHMIQTTVWNNLQSNHASNLNSQFDYNDEIIHDVWQTESDSFDHQTRMIEEEEGLI